MNETDDSYNVCQMQTFDYQYYKSANRSEWKKTVQLGPIFVSETKTIIIVIIKIVLFKFIRFNLYLNTRTHTPKRVK